MIQRSNWSTSSFCTWRRGLGGLRCLTEVLEIWGVQQQRPAPTSAAVNNHPAWYSLHIAHWQMEGWVFAWSVNQVLLKLLSGGKQKKKKTNLGWQEAKDGLERSVSEEGYYFSELNFHLFLSSALLSHILLSQKTSFKCCSKYYNLIENIDAENSRNTW